MIATVAEYSSVIVKGTNQYNIREAFNWIEKEGVEYEIELIFGLDYKIVKYLFEEKQNRKNRLVKK